MAAQVLWHEWFPSIWLDEHQQGTSGPRIFTMPATDPINPNVDPLIYRLNGVFGQSQAAALEAEGKTGIIFNSTYTNFWQGAMAWAGWWHNQVGLLTEVASARIATPTVQQKADPSRAASTSAPAAADAAPPPVPPAAPPISNPSAAAPSSAPTIRCPRRATSPRAPNIPAPGWAARWTLRDIVDYELIATNRAARNRGGRRENLLRQIYDINRNTIEAGKKGEIGQDKEKTFAILIPADAQHDPNEAIDLVDKLLIAGVEVYRAKQGFKQDGKTLSGRHVRHPVQPGVRALRQGHARKADLSRGAPLSRRARRSALRRLRLVARHAVRREDRVRQNAPLAAFPMEKVAATPRYRSRRQQQRRRLALPLQWRALRDGGQPPAERRRQGEPDASPRPAACPTSSPPRRPTCGTRPWKASTCGPIAKPPARSLLATTLNAPRVGIYQSYDPSMDEGWTRWVLDRYQFEYTTLHNEDIKAGQTAPALRRHHPARPAQQRHPRRPRLQDHRAEQYRGGIGDAGLGCAAAVRRRWRHADLAGRGVQPSGGQAAAGRQGSQAHHYARSALRARRHRQPAGRYRPPDRAAASRRTRWASTSTRPSSS